jgi:hypothetical protein
MAHELVDSELCGESRTEKSKEASYLTVRELDRKKEKAKQLWLG